jgi:hypothetical protein
LTEKKGKVMEKKMVRISGIGVLILVIVSMAFLGCQSPPPTQTPPPASSAQPAAPAGTVQTPAPAGTAQTAPAGTPSQDSTQIQVGMTGDQVQKIMGAPGQVEQKGTLIEWKYYTPQGKVEIKLQDNKVTFVERH